MGNDSAISNLGSYHIQEAIKHLKLHEQDLQDYLAELITSLCDVTVEEAFESTDVIYLAHARWLYWYAYRYMTNESYEKIAKRSSRFGHTFHLRSIQSGVNKMAVMIERETLWRQRWSVVKQIIRELQETDDEGKKMDNTIIIQVPRGLKDKIQIKIKEK